jgi:ribose transport system substrate-binding protein
MSRNQLSILSMLMIVVLLSGYVMAAPAVAQTPTPAATDTVAAAPTATYPPPGSKGEIVFVPKSTSAVFYQMLLKGARDKGDELGYTIGYQGPATEADIMAQVDLVRNVIKRKPAGIMLAALDSEALIPVVEESMAAGVPIAMPDSGVNSDVPIFSIITDQYAGGFMGGEYMAELLDHKGLVAVHGIQAGSVSAGRSLGFEEAIAQYPDMEALPTQWTDCDAAKSMNITTDELTGNPDLAGIFHSCAASAGDAEAVKAKGLGGKVKIVSFDPDPQLLPLFEEGTIQAIIAQDPYTMGYEAVRAIDDYINGRPITVTMVELPPTLITPENYEDLLPGNLIITPDKVE